MEIENLFFKNTDEVEEFVRRAIDAQLDNQIKCDYCGQYHDKSEIKSFEKGTYYVCKNDFYENKNRVKIELQNIYIDAEDVVPHSMIEDFFKGYWEE
jgi:hypothetical protein